MLDGENLIHDMGKEYMGFLKQAIQGFRQESQEEYKSAIIDEFEEIKHPDDLPNRDATYLKRP
jgi:hypothetical protein